MGLFLALSGLMGGAGVVLAAVGAHGKPGAGLDNAAHMLLFHATAVLAAMALIDAGRLWRPVAIVVLGGWIVGAALFAGDVAMRAFAGIRLFPMAAPTGGTILILSWLALCVAAIGGRS
jgi:uncharacterized membrane protein YgdD (TMEM256/DUF423 family)